MRASRGSAAAGDMLMDRRPIAIHVVGNSSNAAKMHHLMAASMAQDHADRD